LKGRRLQPRHTLFPLTYGTAGKPCTLSKLERWEFFRSLLGHINHLPELNLPIADRGRFFSEQLGGNPQRFYFLFDSHDFLLFRSENIEGILHWGTPYA
jgi:hypothetical protein